MDPLISICCITYNQENFIEDTIKGFLIQETSFPIEILIHDDASSDKTPKLLKEYEKYDSRISVIYQKENKYSKGKKPFINYLFPKAKGKYIAMCEGDDYWIDPYKLQKQVDFLEANPEYSACFTNAKVIVEGEDKTYLYKKDTDNSSYTIKDIIFKGGGLFPTASLVFKNEIKAWPDFTLKFKSGDRILALLLADFGDFYFLNEITTVYRRHAGGVFSSIRKDKSARKNITKENIELLREYNSFSQFKYNGIIKKAISKLTKKVILYDQKNIHLRQSFFNQDLNWIDRLSLIIQKVKKPKEYE